MDLLFFSQIMPLDLDLGFWPELWIEAQRLLRQQLSGIRRELPEKTGAVWEIVVSTQPLSGARVLA